MEISEKLNTVGYGFRSFEEEERMVYELKVASEVLTGRTRTPKYTLLGIPFSLQKIIIIIIF